MSDTPLNAQQIMQIQKAAADQVEAYITRLQLRKWAVEQVFEASNSINKSKIPGETGSITPEQMMKLAAAVFDFTVQPLKLDLGQ
jgi:hypothetical protein